MDFRDTADSDEAVEALAGEVNADVPPPEIASEEDVEEFNRRYLLANERVPDTDADEPGAMADSPYQKDLPDTAQHREQYPWLFGEQRGIRWDFDPIELRNLAQPNTWVGMMVQSIVTQIAETPFTVVKNEGNAVETQKRLDTHPEERTESQVLKDLPDRTAEEIYDLLRDPNPDDNWQDMVEMWFADMLEIGSFQTTKVFTSAAFDDAGEEFTADPRDVKPVALKPTPPEVWTKEMDDRTGLLTGYWQFDRRSAPASGGSRQHGGGRGIRDPIHFDAAEVMWHDIHPRSNREYGLPPTLMVRDFLALMDLTISQEQNYFSKGALPNGALIGESWDKNDRDQVLSMLDGAKGSPEKMLTLYGAGGDVRYEKFGYNYDELQFTERMKWYARVISSVFQVPTAVVGIEPEQINYSTFQGEKENFEANTLGPYLQLGERIINDQLIRPHWGREYHVEFRPGMSESTRQLRTERVTRQFDANLITRGEARNELGLDDEPAGMDGEPEDGFKSDLVDDPEPEGDVDPAEALGLSAESKDVSNAAGVVFGNVGGDPFGDEDTLNAFVDALREADADSVLIGREVYGDHSGIHDRPIRALGIEPEDAEAVWNEYQSESVGLSGPRVAESIEDVFKSSDRGDSGNPSGGSDAPDPETVANAYEQTGGHGAALSKDDPLRNTDEWGLFDVQPGEVERVAEQIAGDVDALFDQLMSDEAIQQDIAQLAAPDDEADTEKSLTSLTGRIRDLLDESDLAASLADTLRGATAEAAGEALRSAMSETDADPDLDADTIAARLSDRDVTFADTFADRIAEDVRETVADGWADGKTTREIGDDIESLAGDMEGWGAEKIARQELQIATGEARSAFANETGKIELWLVSGGDPEGGETEGDGRVRPGHQKMNGKWKYPTDDWKVDYTEEGRGVHKESVPGDSSAGIGCRCQVLLRDRDEVDADDYGGDGTP